MRTLVLPVVVAGLCAVAPASQARDQSDAMPGAVIDDAGDPGDARGETPWMAGTSLADRRAAHALFLEGNQLMDELAFAEAEKKYRDAIEKWNHPVFHFNRTIARINLLQPVEAYESINQALAYGAAPFQPDRYRLALGYKQALESRLARVVIECDQAGVVVTLDGHILFTGPGRHTGVMQPGSHQLVATRDGYITYTDRIVGDAGKETRARIRLRPPERIEAVRAWAAWKPWAVVMGGALVLGGAGFLDVGSSRGFADYDRRFAALCGIEGCRKDELPASLRVRLSDAETRQWMARFAYGLAGATLAAGAVLLYLNRETYIKVGAPESSSITVAPFISDESAGIRAGVRF